MKTAGIIAEYNPFHNGHQYHIEETRRRTGADYVIAVLSGDFVQRGAPALLSKYDRARMALLSGADLVFSLPVTTSLSSAEGFATGGIALLDGLGVVDVVSCGCEDGEEKENTTAESRNGEFDCPDDALFSAVCRVLATEPPTYKETLDAALRAGVNFPRAREEAVTVCLNSSGARPTNDAIGPESDTDRTENKTGNSGNKKTEFCPDPVPSPEALHRLLSEPNHLLSLAYAQAIEKIESPMELCRIPRREAPHHSDTISGSYASATAIRKSLLSGKKEDSALSGVVPREVWEVLTQTRDAHALLSENDFSDLLFYALNEHRAQLRDFGPENPDLAHRTANLLEQFTGWTDFAALLKTKNQTYTAISRYLAQILLGIRREDLALAARYDYAPYARLLGFREEAAPLLTEIREHATMPILTQPAKDAAALSENRRRLFNLDVQAAELYRHEQVTRSGKESKSELRQPLITIPYLHSPSM